MEGYGLQEDATVNGHTYVECFVTTPEYSITRLLPEIEATIQRWICVYPKDAKAVFDATRDGTYEGIKVAFDAIQSTVAADLKRLETENAQLRERVHAAEAQIPLLTALIAAKDETIASLRAPPQPPQLSQKERLIADARVYIDKAQLPPRNARQDPAITAADLCTISALPLSYVREHIVEVLQEANLTIGGRPVRGLRGRSPYALQLQSPAS